MTIRRLRWACVLREMQNQPREAAECEAGVETGTLNYWPLGGVVLWTE